MFRRSNPGRTKRFLSQTSRPVLGAPYSKCTAFLSRGQSGRGVMSTIHLRLVVLRMSGVVLPLHYTPSCCVKSYFAFYCLYGICLLPYVSSFYLKHGPTGCVRACVRLIVCDLQTSRVRRPRHELGRCATEKKNSKCSQWTRFRTSCTFHQLPNSHPGSPVNLLLRLLTAAFLKIP